MKLLLDCGNNRRLKEILDAIPGNIKEIKASVAYNTDKTLLETADKQKIKLYWWGLFDVKESTTIEFMEYALKSDTIVFHPVKRNFHSKLIYFVNHGLYVGSANMTEKALTRNIETGVYLTYYDLKKNGLMDQLNEYFRYMESEHSYILTENDLDDLRESVEKFKKAAATSEKEEQKLEDEFSEKFKHFDKKKDDSEKPKKKKVRVYTIKDEQKKKEEEELAKQKKREEQELAEQKKKLLNLSSADIKWVKTVNDRVTFNAYLPGDKRLERIDDAYYYTIQVKVNPEDSRLIIDNIKEKLKEVNIGEIIIIYQNIKDHQKIPWRCFTHLVTPVDNEILAGKGWLGRYVKVAAMAINKNNLIKFDNTNWRSGYNWESKGYRELTIQQGYFWKIEDKLKKEEIGDLQREIWREFSNKGVFYLNENTNN